MKPIEDFVTLTGAANWHYDVAEKSLFEESKATE